MARLMTLSVDGPYIAWVMFCGSVACELSDSRASSSEKLERERE